MRPITHKMVQVHWECVCGHNTVDQDSFPIRWRDLARAGIQRKRDRATGKPFLLSIIKSTVCRCNEEN